MSDKNDSHLYRADDPFYNSPLGRYIDRTHPDLNINQRGTWSGRLQAEENTADLINVGVTDMYCLQLTEMCAVTITQHTYLDPVTMTDDGISWEDEHAIQRTTIWMILVNVLDTGEMVHQDVSHTIVYGPNLC